VAVVSGDERGGVTLREIAREDFDDLFALVAAYVEELDDFDPLEAAGPDYVHAMRERYEADLDADDSEERELFWILEGRVRAGFLLSRRYAEWPAGERDMASISEFYVLPAYRRRGIGRTAVEAWLALHRERGTWLVEADILHENHAARAFWASLGFEVQMLQTARRP
jgi:ribosomal protein S18 acetylase RimI-like enzyme